MSAQPQPRIYGQTLGPTPVDTPIRTEAGRVVTLPYKFKDIFKPYRYKAFHGGRGSGKSHSVASALVLMGAQRPIRWLCTREIQKSIDASVKQLMEDKIVLHGLQDRYRVTTKVIRGTNGTVFYFSGMKNNPEAVKSMEGLDGAWYEEADKCSVASLRLLTPTLRKEGSELWFTWNRRLPTDPVDEFFLGGTPPPNAIVEQVNYMHNPWFPDELRQEMEWMKERNYELYLHIWEGQPIQATKAAVFKNWRREELKIPRGASPRFGADWGYSIDPTVLIKVYRWGKTLYVSDEAHSTKCEIDDIPALFCGDSVQRRWLNPKGFKGVKDAEKYTIVADSSRPETIGTLRRKYNMKIRGAKKGNDSVYEGIRFLQSHEIVVHPKCELTIYEMTKYRYKLDPHTGDVLPELEDKNNHAIDALRYALENDRKADRFAYSGDMVATASQVFQL